MMLERGRKMTFLGFLAKVKMPPQQQKLYLVQLFSFFGEKNTMSAQYRLNPGSRKGFFVWGTEGKL